VVEIGTVSIFYTMAGLTIKFLVQSQMFDQTRENGTERKLTATNLTAVNPLIDEASGSPPSIIINRFCSCG